MKIKVKNIFISLLLVGTYSCATFSNKIVKEEKVKIKENELEKISGFFALHPFKLDQSERSDFELSNSTFKDLMNENAKVYDTLSDYKIHLSFRNKHQLQYVLIEEGLPVESLIIEGKLKKNGLFYISKKEKNRIGIPFVAGGYNISKTRIGINKENNLFVDTSYVSAGGVFILLMNSSKSNSYYEFKRMD